MSQYAGIVNPRKALRESVTTTQAVLSPAATEIYVTIPWPVFSTVERIVVAATSNFQNLVVESLTDAAAYRDAASADKPMFVTGRYTQSGSATNWYAFDATTFQTEDARRAGYLYLRLSVSSGSFTGGIEIQVTAEGYARLPVSINDMDRAPWRKDPHFRVMRLVSGATVAEDITAETGYNLQPMQIGQGPTCFASDTDELYIGSDKRFSSLEFVIASGAQPTTSSFTYEYWDGSTWSSLTPLDNTSDGHIGGFSYSGTVGLPDLSDWSPTHVDEDPVKVMMDAIVAGTHPPVGMSFNPPRYWVRIRPNALDGTLKFSVVRTLN